MADWKQITARIRRARGSRDPGGQLALLYEKTSDAMVAFELGRHFELAKDSAKSLEWYLIAAKRFRRGDWKTKAREAVVRLGGELPPDTEIAGDMPAEAVASTEAAASVPAETTEAPPEQDSDTQQAADSAVSGEPKRRRRGRRGGRNRRKVRPAGAPQESRSTTTDSEADDSSGTAIPVSTSAEILPPRVVDSRAIPRMPVEPMPESGPAVKGRFGDPGLSSRLSVLEMQLRRLLTCSPAKLEDSARAPAGPGVFVLTDDEMTTYYYVESCDTLRIAISSLARGGMSRRGNTNLKALLADNLEISEARATKYMAEHCVVRWLQLDDGAATFQHFAIAVLRPLLNE